MIFTPITSSGNLLLAAQPIEKTSPVTAVRQPVHHIFVIDKSGSMYGTLPELIEDLKRQVRQLQKGDAVTFAWFSSRGESGFPIKVFRIVDESSFAELDRLFDQHKRAMNLTCFSGVLGEVEKILDETSFLAARNCLTFFSDGWANDRSVAEEHTRVREIMNRLNGRFDLVLTVAYSDYADRSFLAEMAQAAGGECISSAYLHQFTDALSRFMKRAEITQPRILFSFDKIKTEGVFTLDTDTETGGITVYQPNEINAVYISPTDKNAQEYLYFLCTDNSEMRAALTSLGGVNLHLQPLLQTVSPELLDEEGKALLSGAYATSIVLSQSGRQNEAIEVLGYLGDEWLVEKLGSAFTPTERANAEDVIRKAVLDPSERWRTGQIFNCLPKPDAFCLLDLLETLTRDPEAKFFPRHPEFKYKKIGRGGKMREGFPAFTAYENAASSFSDLVWNSELLNLSVRAKIQGYVELPDTILVDSVGNLSLDGSTLLQRPASLQKLFPSFQWRNYALVKDGFLNIERLPVSVSHETTHELLAYDLFAPDWSDDEGKRGVISLSAIPIVNKLIAENSPNALNLAKKAFDDELLSAQLKAFKFLRDELDPKKELVAKTTWTIEEQRFLTALGFSSDGSYNPPVDLEEATDYYEATCFKISVKGFSSLPKVADVRDRLKTSKSLTPSMLPMADALERFNKETNHFSLEEKIRWIDEQVSAIKILQTQIRTEIQKPKFAMVLGHKWFEDVQPGSDVFEIKLAGTGGNDLMAKISIGKKQIRI